MSLILITLTGCLHYDVHIRVDEAEEVTVSERIVMDAEWVESVGDTMEASRQVIERYGQEAKERGGKVETFGRDSAHAMFRYDTLAEFAQAWPDTADNGSRWDRAVHRQRTQGDTLLNELILFRMSPPDPNKRLPNQKLPTMTFTLYLPMPATDHNAHREMGNTYWWQFTEAMSAPDSVYLAWPAKTAP
jgi:hypothetical protein